MFCTNCGKKLDDDASDEAEKEDAADDKKAETKLDKPTGPAPEGAIDNWEYTLDGDYVTLEKYKGDETDVIVYAGYPADGKVYKTKFADASQMFQACKQVESIVFADGIDTSNMERMYAMFSGCRSLTSLDLSSLDTSNVKHMTEMFIRCSSLISLDLSSFDTSNVESSMDEIFKDCTNLTVTATQATKDKHDDDDCPVTWKIVK